MSCKVTESYFIARDEEHMEALLTGKDGRDYWWCQNRQHRHYILRLWALSVDVMESRDWA